MLRFRLRRRRGPEAVRVLDRGRGPYCVRDVLIYLLHFDTPYRHAGHYLGFTKHDSVDERVAKHAAGTGSRLMQVVVRAGITFKLARTWEGGRVRERQLKKQGGASRRCPICLKLKKEKNENPVS